MFANSRASGTDRIREWSDHTTIVSFKAAPPKASKDKVKQLAEDQALRTDSGVVFANTIGSLETDVLIWVNGEAKWFTSRDDALKHLVAWLKSKPE